MSTDLVPGPARRLRTALFVDFDNVYIGLRRLDPDAAEAFATDPGHWLGELESGSDADGDFARRFLVRACYLNPSVYSRFRPNFTRAGFQVVDCPSLTQQGKSSADINLVLDAVDALAADARYDEFVIVSADADFTPLAQRCRAADRRVTIITASPAASAYRAVADTVINADELADLVTVGGPPAASEPDPEPEVTATGGGSGAGTATAAGSSWVAVTPSRPERRPAARSASHGAAPSSPTAWTSRAPAGTWPSPGSTCRGWGMIETIRYLVVWVWSNRFGFCERHTLTRSRGTGQVPRGADRQRDAAT